MVLPSHGPGQRCRELEAMQVVENDEGTNPLIQVVRPAAEFIQLRGGRKQLLRRRAPAHAGDRLVPDGGIAGSDETNETGHSRTQ